MNSCRHLRTYAVTRDLGRSLVGLPATLRPCWAFGRVLRGLRPGATTTARRALSTNWGRPALLPTSNATHAHSRGLRVSWLLESRTAWARPPYAAMRPCAASFAGRRVGRARGWPLSPNANAGFDSIPAFRAVSPMPCWRHAWLWRAMLRNWQARKPRRFRRLTLYALQNATLRIGRWASASRCARA